MSAVAEHRAEIDLKDGDGESGPPGEIDTHRGFSRYRDHVTANLGLLASTWLSLHKQYQATVLRAKHGSPALKPILTSAAADTKEVREKIGKELTRAIRGHVLYSWLKDARSTGVHVTRLIAVIGDPLRFPGRLCTEGHHSPGDWAGDVCFVPVGEKGVKLSEMTLCGEPITGVRRGTGVRSLWHYLGLHVDTNGRSPQKRKGQQATWSPIGRSCVLQPEGIADQIVRHRKEPWRGIYDSAKERLRVDRGVVDVTREVERMAGDPALRKNDSTGSKSEIVRGIGAKLGDVVTSREFDAEFGIVHPAGGEAETGSEIERINGLLRPYQIDALARKIAVKAFVGDLLVEWKHRVVS